MAYGLNINGTATEFGNNKSKKACISASLFVIPRGFEPRTHSLEGCCSIQLSYGTEGANIRIFPEYP